MDPIDLHKHWINIYSIYTHCLANFGWLLSIESRIDNQCLVHPGVCIIQAGRHAVEVSWL